PFSSFFALSTGLNKAVQIAIDLTTRSLAGMTDKTGSHKEMQRLPPAATEQRLSRSFRLAPRLMRRNFSSRAPELSGGKAIILSVPKSGRTWIRTFLCAYF